jgi:hypothetical protein
MYSSAMYVQTNTYLDNLKRDYQFGGIAFLYMWDILRDTFNEVKSGNEFADYQVSPVPGHARDVNLEDVWDAYEKDPWGGFDVDQSNVLDWLFASDLIKEYEEEEAEVSG